MRLTEPRYITHPELRLPDSAQVSNPDYFRLTRVVVNPLMDTFPSRIITGGQENIPDKGPYILYGKHSSLNDIGALGTSFLYTTGNTMTFVGKDKLWDLGLHRVPVGQKQLEDVTILGKRLGDIQLGGLSLRKLGLGTLLEWGDVIPFDQESGRQTVEVQAAMNAPLERGGVLALFPERHRYPNFIPENIGAGVLAMMAIEFGAVLVPVGIEGTTRYSSKNAVYYGAPLNLERATASRTSQDEGERKRFRDASRSLQPQVRPGLVEAQMMAGRLLVKAA